MVRQSFVNQRHYGYPRLGNSKPQIQLFTPDTFANTMIKSLLGFIAGVIIVFLIQDFLVFQLDISPPIATPICIVMGFFLSLGLAFHIHVRCVLFLMLPELFSKQGRNAVIAYIYLLLLSGPMKNAILNIDVLTESIACGQERISNETRSLLQDITSPLSGVVKVIRSVIQALVDFSSQMRKAFVAIKDLFDEIIGALKRIAVWLNELVNSCNEKMGGPYRKCKKAFDDAVTSCQDILPWILEFLCFIVTIVSWVCEIAKIIKVLCLIPKAISKRLSSNLLKRWAGRKYYFTTKEMLYWIRDLKCMTFRALLYRWRFRKSESFDNYYLSWLIIDLNIKRSMDGKETIFPLTNSEAKRYIKPLSVRLLPHEKRNLASAVFGLIGHGIQIIVYITIDYTMWKLLEMVRHHGAVKTLSEVPAHVKMHVDGSGVLADMYRNLLSSFDPLMEVAPEVDTTVCLPKANHPNFAQYSRIGTLFGLCILLAVFQAYGLRFRHSIAESYYPEMKQKRAVWLYNHILRSRAGLVKYLRRQVRKKDSSEEASRKGSASESDYEYQYGKRSSKGASDRSSNVSEADKKELVSDSSPR
ncbi:DC-STAMP domain-containing protein 2-like, partial [Limulus polyphemus]|uniref:DC-STAMP domain-containing protein 2-like n=1 Tax=Limulus polyphemus TaxID=6850 RepID=A0ABM1SXK4_LIMPO